jgi:hypothetical protein
MKINEVLHSFCGHSSILLSNLVSFPLTSYITHSHLFSPLFIKFRMSFDTFVEDKHQGVGFDPGDNRHPNFWF